ncbi:tetratricopeptide repeat protein [Rhodoplanes sp. TEM]|uniref:Tetratricopeptide repeat protein n=1 Tax=Rhodoplanes tepidamans TaxID=200616 RepID=A0ABT5JEF4_RHOTP|nr:MULTISPECIES: tetratricopeptide repeat protein [Rhodoplanes]MDC7787912.1 tetratricopeptide repeat protein [Rhodoplanes tepidamans]MDC7986429.1 tetratricopeptide repeat protein [Rhodoplanes sp. TEM]MDQ0353756.1 putative TPR repeat methyltransferase [Rhodoplanes tepidamans]
MNRRDRRAAAKQGNAEAICAAAAALKAQGRLEAAVKRYREAIEVAPQSVVAHNNLANVLTELGRTDEAVAHLRAALAAAPAAVQVHNNLGNALRRQGDTAAAVAYYRQAIAHKPDFAEAHLNLGSTLAALGDTAAALAHLDRAVALRPFHAESRIRLGLALVEAGDTAAALGCAEVAARTAQEPGFPLRLLGLLLARCGATEPARACLEAVLARDPEDRDGTRLLLARLGAVPLPERASDRQIESLYAARAAGWDAGAGPHAYRGAALVADALARTSPEGLLDIADTGCGTGLVGVLVKHRARRLDGVDLSAPMIAQARAKALYDTLHQGDLVAFLLARPAAFDAVTCAATLIHFGDLAPALAAAATALRDGGVVVATLFPNADDPDAVAVGSLDGLAQGGCFVHGRAYVERTAAAAGFAVEILEEAVHEHQAGRDRTALVVGLRRRSRDS